jgi:hypothetical protein
MTLFDMISSVRGYLAPDATDQQCVARLQEAQEQVINAVGPSNPKLKSLLRGILRTYITSTLNYVQLPNDAGEVIRGGLTFDSKVSDVLGLEDKDVPVSNSLFSRAGYREGNRITFPGASKYLSIHPDLKQIAIHAVYERPVRQILLAAGLRVHSVAQKFSFAGQALSVFEIGEPLTYNWGDDYLQGGTLRMIMNKGEALDYDIFGNHWPYVYVMPNPTRQTINLPSFNTFNKGGDVHYPAVITYVGAPTSLAVAMLDWIRGKSGKDNYAFLDFQRNIGTFK